MMRLFSKIGENSENWLLALLLFLIITLMAFIGCITGLDDSEWIIDNLGVSEAQLPEYEALKILGIGIGGLLIAVQAVIANKRAKAMQQTAQAQADAAKAQAMATVEQAKANANAEQGQRQERLKNSIEHLGHNSDSVRMGGAYELFHLARDAQGWEDSELRQTVFRILCAHIRRTTGDKEYQAEHKSKPSEEVQSLLTLLFVQNYQAFTDFHVNLRGTWLNGANLREARLEKAVLTEAHLHGVTLVGANLKEADMTEGHLQGADLTDAEMQKATLRRTLMQGACLNGARLREAWLYSTQMQGVRLLGARMEGAYLSHTEMQGADLYEARLQLAKLSNVKLQAGRLARAQFQGATLSGVHLGGVNDGMDPVEMRLRDRVEREAILNGTVFQGGLTKREVECIVEMVSDELPGVRRARLEWHIDKPTSHELPQNSGVNTEPYTAEEAEAWIAEYKAAMSEVPEVD